MTRAPLVLFVLVGGAVSAQAEAQSASTAAGEAPSASTAAGEAPSASTAAGAAPSASTENKVGGNSAAQAQSGVVKLPEGWFLPAGVNVGEVDHPRGVSGTVLGAEASVVLFPVGHGVWNGLYADGLYDFASQRVRVSPGLEWGYLFLGVDGGPVFQFGESALRVGLEVRPMLSLGVVHIYGRWAWLFGSTPDDRFREIGVLLKFPFHLIDTKRQSEGAGGKASPSPAVDR